MDQLVALQFNRFGQRREYYRIMNSNQLRLRAYGSHFIFFTGQRERPERAFLEGGPEVVVGQSIHLEDGDVRIVRIRPQREAEKHEDWSDLIFDIEDLD